MAKHGPLVGAAAAGRKAASKAGAASRTKASAAPPEKPAEEGPKQRGALRTWKHVPPKRCFQCEPTTHEFDRDAVGQQQLLAWSKFAKNSVGVERPVGEECYRCYDTRRKHFGEYDLRGLKAKREEHRCVDDKFTELRGARVRGETMYKSSEKVDIDQLVKKSSRDFSERYVEGAFTALPAFCAQRGLACPESDDECMDNSGKELAQNLINMLLEAVELVVTHKGTALLHSVTPLFAVGYAAEGAEEMRQKYNEQQEEAVERDEYMTLNLLSEAVAVLRQGAGGDANLKASEEMLNLAADVYFVWAEFVKPDVGAPLTMKRWTTLWNRFLELNKGPATVYVRKFFNGLRQALDMERLILSFLQRPWVLAVVQGLEHMLPKQVGEYIFVAVTLNAVSVAGEKFKTSPGTAPGFLEVSWLLSEVAKVKRSGNPLFTARRGATENINIVESAWKNMLDNMLQRCESVGELDSFLETMGDVVKSIADWAEDAFPDWLKKGEDDKINATSAKVEQCVGQLPTWKKQLERVSQMMGWASAEEKKRVKDTLDKFGAWEKLVADVALRLAVVAVTAGYLTLPSESEGNTSERRSQMEYVMKYTATKLLIKTEALPVKLRELVQKAVAKPIAEKSAAAIVSAGGAAADQSKTGKRLTRKSALRL